MRRDEIDFFVIEPHQQAMHDRLENWARWVIPRHQSWVNPMFRFSKSNSRQWHPVEIRLAIDPKDAALMEKSVIALPPKHREAVRWCYVYQGSPRKQCARLGVTEAALDAMVRDGRQMLINRLPGN